MEDNRKLSAMIMITEHNLKTAKDKAVQIYNRDLLNFLKELEAYKKADLVEREQVAKDSTIIGPSGNRYDALMEIPRFEPETKVT